MSGMNRYRVNIIRTQTFVFDNIDAPDPFAARQMAREMFQEMQEADVADLEIAAETLEARAFFETKRQRK